MNRTFLGVVVVALAWAVAAPTTARAETPVGYLHVGVAAPWHYAANATRADPFEGPWQLTRGFARRPALVGLDALSVGAGLGYSGLNVQADLRTLGDASRASVTAGLRLKLGLGRFELWGRVAAGPQYVLSVANFSARRDAGVGVTAVLEMGADVFLVDRRLALGVRAGGAPGYLFPASFGVDLGLAGTLRLLL